MMSIFYIERSKLCDRYDPSFYIRSYKLTNAIPLYRLVEVLGGKRIPQGYTYASAPTDYLYLRVADISDSLNIDYRNLKFIDSNVYDKLCRYEIFNDNLAISIAGTIGKVVYIQAIPNSKHVILTENCAKLIVKNNKDVLPLYLKIVLELDVVQQQIQDNYIQTTIPKLSLERIKHLSIPVLPSIEKQQEIVDLYVNAYNEKQHKEKQSESLLNSIDDYLLNELGVKLPKIESRVLNDRIFTVNYSEIIGGRMDPKSVLFLGEFAKSVKYENVLLRQAAIIKKGDAITSSDVNKAGHYPVIAGGQTSPYNHDKFNYSGDVITVSASGAYSGYVWYHKDPIFASDCSVIYAKNNQFVTEYLFEVLKAQQSHIYLLQQGAGQPHVYPDDLGKLWIPVVPLSKQQEIIKHIKVIRQQAKALQEEGKAILEEAKRELEKMILG